MKYFRRKLRQAFWFGVGFALLSSVLTASDSVRYSGVMQARTFTRVVEFDYATWMLSALLDKGLTGTLDVPRSLSIPQQRELVFSYIQGVQSANLLEWEIERIYADPAISDPDAAAADFLRQQAEVEALLTQAGALVEAVIQQQVSGVLAEKGLAIGGQTIPPTLYQVTPLPLALILSPRDAIRQDADISLLSDLSLDEITALERSVEDRLTVSALVVPVGGVGVYPTMVMRSTNLPWLVDTVAHEWAHNFLTLRPLGMLYYSTPALRTMNETTANILGNEVREAVLRRYYPEFARPSAPAAPFEELNPPPTQGEPVAFDFRAEMHKTRLAVDALLAEGKIEQAEAYMEAQRQVFVANGYSIRRLNQAYFAFYGAYADAPRGAFGSDPVGPLVRGLRIQSDSLKTFINRIAWMTSFERLREEVTGRR
jgi:hypothetical protein